MVNKRISLSLSLSRNKVMQKAVETTETEGTTETTETDEKEELSQMRVILRQKLRPTSTIEVTRDGIRHQTRSMTHGRAGAPLCQFDMTASLVWPP